MIGMIVFFSVFAVSIVAFFVLIASKLNPKKATETETKVEEKKIKKETSVLSAVILTFIFALLFFCFFGWIGHKFFSGQIQPPAKTATVAKKPSCSKHYGTLSWHKPNWVKGDNPNQRSAFPKIVQHFEKDGFVILIIKEHVDGGYKKSVIKICLKNGIGICEKNYPTKKILRIFLSRYKGHTMDGKIETAEGSGVFVPFTARL